jgi:hypothetical protein
MSPAVRGKRRCRMHGGKSTGPRTAEGLARSRRSRWVHGRYSLETLRARRAARDRAAAELWKKWAVPAIARGFLAVPIRYRNVVGVRLVAPLPRCLQGRPARAEAESRDA